MKSKIKKYSQAHSKLLKQEKGKSSVKAGDMKETIGLIAELTVLEPAFLQMLLRVGSARVEKRRSRWRRAKQTKQTKKRKT